MVYFLQLRGIKFLMDIAKIITTVKKDIKITFPQKIVANIIGINFVSVPGENTN